FAGSNTYCSRASDLLGHRGIRPPRDRSFRSKDVTRCKRFASRGSLCQTSKEKAFTDECHTDRDTNEISTNRHLAKLHHGSTFTDKKRCSRRIYKRIPHGSTSCKLIPHGSDIYRQDTPRRHLPVNSPTDQPFTYRRNARSCLPMDTPHSHLQAHYTTRVSILLNDIPSRSAFTDKCTTDRHLPNEMHHSHRHLPNEMHHTDRLE
ncbi:hypothetical protein AVEN_43938-1, partial [Araneus ventricosus]